MNSLFLNSPAKINLNLQILDKREDGYHNLKSEFRTINLFDKITLTKIPEGIQLIISGNYKIPNNRDNLVYQVAEKLRSYATGKVGVKIEIEKNIPLFAGLGGGSSNAATVLKGLNQLWDLHLTLEKQIEIGAKIGADVPFFLYGGKCLVEGIGEKVTPLQTEEKSEFIIVAQLPHIKIATPWAYAQIDKLRITNYELKVPFSAPLEGGRGVFSQGEKKQSISQKEPPGPLVKGENMEIENDFEKVIFPHFPDLENLKESFLKNGAVKSNLTGSGSAVYGIFEEREIAEKCLEKIREKCEFCWLGGFL